MHRANRSVNPNSESILSEGLRHHQSCYQVDRSWRERVWGKGRETKQTVWYLASSESLFLHVKLVSLLVLYAVGGFSFFTFVNNPG